MSKNGVKPKTLGIFLGIVLVFALFLRLQQAFTGKEVRPEEQKVVQVQPVVNSEPAKVELKSVVSAQYHITVQIPSNWTEDANSLFNEEFTRYQGNDGYVSFDVAGSEDQTIDQATSNLASSLSKPFGTEPAITSATIDGQSARFILPSADQVRENHNESALIIEYKTPTVIDGKSYKFLVLYVNKDSVYDIGQSLKIGA